jgi:cell division protein FtsQ
MQTMMLPLHARLRPLAARGQKFGDWLSGVRHPNAWLFGGVLLPVLVAGFLASNRFVDEREELALSLSSVAAHVGFGVDAITIEGLRDTREGDVLDYLAVGPDTSLLGFDIESARDRVRALPWVKEASVRRVYPDTLFVEIEEHAPFARLLDDGRIHLVTLEGEEITDEIGDHHAGLPLVVGEGAPREATAFFNELAERPHVLGQVVAMERVGSRRWTLHMNHGVQVHLPETQSADALMQLETMMRRHAILERAVEAIDLRRPEQLIVRLTDQGLEAMGVDGEDIGVARGGA